MRVAGEGGNGCKQSEPLVAATAAHQEESNIASTSILNSHKLASLLRPRGPLARGHVVVDPLLHAPRANGEAAESQCNAQEDKGGSCEVGGSCWIDQSIEIDSEKRKPTRSSDIRRQKKWYLLSTYFTYYRTY